MTRVERLTRDASEPERLMEALDRQGAMVLSGLDSVSPDALHALADTIGRADTGIDEDLIGPPLMHLRHDAGRSARTDRPAYFTADAFPLHTDVSYVPEPPRYLLVYCVDPGGAGGDCLLADSHPAVAGLDPATRERLSRPRYRFAFPPGCPQGQSDPCPVLSDGDRLRYKPGAMSVPADCRAAVSALGRALDAVKISIRLDAGELLILDNHRVAHGRTAFSTDGKGGRHLMRMYAVERPAQRS